MEELWKIIDRRDLTEMDLEMEFMHVQGREERSGRPE